MDKEVTQFWQFKKRNSGQVPKKRAVSTIGKQADNQTWVLSKGLYIDAEKGEKVDPSKSSYAWIGHLRRGRGIAPHSQAIEIKDTLTTDGLHPLIEALNIVMQHNFVPTLMALGSTGLCMHYKTLVDRNGECFAPLICGDVGTGKSMALRAALSLFGSHRSRFYSRGTREKLLQHLSHSTFPIGIDDPQKPDAIGELMVDLFNGAKSTTITHGDIQPMSTGIITANFDLAHKKKDEAQLLHINFIPYSVIFYRYYTRTVIIPFQNPPLGKDISAENLAVLSSLDEKFYEASRAVGFLISLGNILTKEGFDEIRTEFHPLVSEHLKEFCHPRIIFGYSTLLWFTSKVRKK